MGKRKATNPRIYVDARLPWGSGIGRYVSSLLPEIARLRDDWHFIVGVRGTTHRTALPALGSLPNITVLDVPIAPFSAAEQTRLYRSVPGHDLAWFTNYIVPLFWPGRFIATVHDLLHLRPDLFPSTRLERIASRLSMHAVRVRASGIIFVSSFSQREFGRMIGHPARGAVIHHGVDHFSEVSLPFEKDRLALIVSAPKFHKNVETAISAWIDAAPPEPWKLVVVSPGDEIRSKVDSGAIGSDSIQVLNAIQNGQLDHLYKRSSLFLFPSRYEGFGFPILEAALSGARIISSNAGALREVSEGMELTALDPDDIASWSRAIRHATSMPPVTHENGGALANIEVARRFTWRRAAEETVEYIASVLSEK